MDQHIPRWTFASLADYFKLQADGVPLNFFAEGLDEDEPSDFRNDSVLFRLNGPSPRKGSGIKIWKLEVQILLTDLVTSTGESPYDIYTWAGIFALAMENSIPITKVGTGVDDDQTLLACLEPDPSVSNHIRIVNYGQVDITARVRQVSVNGRFQFCTQ